MKKVLITNTLNHPLNLFYRVPAKKEGDISPLIEVTLPARAMLHEVIFSDDSYFDHFEKQNKAAIDAQKIILGKTSEKQAEKVSNDNAAKAKGEIKKRKDKVIESFEETASGTNVNMKFEVKGGE